MQSRRGPLVIYTLTLIFLTFFVQHSNSSAQSNDFEDLFSDPSLPGWEHTDAAFVEDGALVLEQGGFAYHSESWTDFSLLFRAKYEGDGDLAVTYRPGILLLFNGTRFEIVQMEADPGEQSPQAVPFPIPPGEWFQVEISVESILHLVRINQQTIFEIVFSDPIPPGGIAFELFGNGRAAIDDLIVHSVGSNNSPDTVDQEQKSDRDSQEPDETSENPQSAAQPNAQLSWIRTGGPPGGLGYDIRYNFADPNIWYATDNYGGIHISYDNGLTWQQSNQGIPPQAGPSGDAIPVFCLTVDPHNPQIVWSGTDITGHIYKSVDGGKSWTQKDNGIKKTTDGLTFRGFTIDPHSSDIVYAMGEITKYEEGDAIWVPRGGFIYRTVDGGDNWQLIWDGTPPSSLTRYLWVNPEDPNILYASTGIFDRGAVNQAPLDQIMSVTDPFGGLGILKSTDGGKNWQILGKDQGLNHLYITSLFMDPQDPDILLAATGHDVPEAALEYYSQTNDSPIGVYRTSDGGNTWTKVLGQLPGHGGEIFTSVEFCPSDSRIVYAGSNTAVYRSEDRGLTWELVSGGARGWGPAGGVNGIPIDMQCDPRNPDRIFANNYQGGNYLSEDGGVTWVDASTGYTGAQVISVSVAPDQPATVFSSGRNGVWKSSDGGMTWKGVLNLRDDQPILPEWGAVVIDPSQPNRVLLGTEGLYISEDLGQTWAYQSLPELHPWITAIQFAPSNPQVIYLGGAEHNALLHPETLTGRGMMVSDDGGQNWDSIAGEQFSDEPVLDIAIDPTDADHVYTATPKGLFQSTDRGKDWSIVDGLPDGSVVSVEINLDDPTIIFASIDPLGLYRSKDGGLSWQHMESGLEPNGSHRDILFDPTNPSILYLADLSSGVYQSLDGGSTWSKINQGLTMRAVTNLSISSDGQHLYASTNGEGVFRLDINGTVPQGLTAQEQINAEISEGEQPTSPAVQGDQAPDEQLTRFAGTGSSYLLYLIFGLVLAASAIGIWWFVTRKQK